jgi:hypothetical protein
MSAKPEQERHFGAMIRLIERLSAAPAEILEHHYSYQSFGSWSCVVRCRGVVLRITFDGRERDLVVQRSTSRKPPHDWGTPSWRKVNAADADFCGPELIAAVERAAGQQADQV